MELELHERNSSSNLFYFILFYFIFFKFNCLILDFEKIKF